MSKNIPPPHHGGGGGFFGNIPCVDHCGNNNNIEGSSYVDQDHHHRQQHQQQPSSLFCGKKSVGTLYVDPVVEGITRQATVESSAEEWMKAVDEVYGSQHDPELEFDYLPDGRSGERSSTVAATSDNSISSSRMEEDIDDDDDDILSTTEVEKLRTEFVTNKINDLLKAIDQLPNNMKRRNLDKAFFVRPKLRHDNDFLLMFLRSVDYNATKAAEKIRIHFNTKYELWGIEKLVRNITIDDFTAKELDAIQKFGRTRFLNQRCDRIGRPIEFLDARYFKKTFDDLITFKKWTWYQIMNIYQNNDTVQKFGLVSILYAPFSESMLEEMKYTLMQQTKELVELNDSLPYKVASYHFCYDNTMMNVLISGLSTAFGKPLRLRLATHFGSNLEITYSLESKYGLKVPSNRFEDTGDEMEIAASIEEYLSGRKILEQQERDDLSKLEGRTQIIEFPQSQDFLIEGRRQKGSILSCIEFPGNKRLGVLCNDCANQYSQSEYNFEKERLINGVIADFRKGGRYRSINCDAMQRRGNGGHNGDDERGDRMDDEDANSDGCAIAAPGGRFLKRVDGGWTVVNEKVAYQKAWRIINDSING